MGNFPKQRPIMGRSNTFLGHLTSSVGEAFSWQLRADFDSARPFASIHLDFPVAKAHLSQRRISDRNDQGCLIYGQS